MNFAAKGNWPRMNTERREYDKDNGTPTSWEIERASRIKFIREVPQSYR